MSQPAPARPQVELYGRMWPPCDGWEGTCEAAGTIAAGDRHYCRDCDLQRLFGRDHKIDHSVSEPAESPGTCQKPRVE